MKKKNNRILSRKYSEAEEYLISNMLQTISKSDEFEWFIVYYFIIIVGLVVVSNCVYNLYVL